MSGPEFAAQEDRVKTSCPKVRALAVQVRDALVIMRDEDDDDDGWALPDLTVIARGMTALHALVQHAEDRRRFKNALDRIAKEWTDEGASPDAIRNYARSVVAGASARIRIEERP